MRFNILRESPTPNLFLTDSQGKALRFPNFNVLSAPGARIKDFYNFLPQPGQYETIVLFVGGNDLFNGRNPSSASELDIANELCLLADMACTLAPRVFVIGIPPRHYQPQRSKHTNQILAAQASGWLFRGISKVIYDEDLHVRRDRVHLNHRGLSGVRSILKQRVLRAKFSERVDREGHTGTFYCSHRRCICGLSRN